jgi:hypothetical protein
MGAIAGVFDDAPGLAGSIEAAREAAMAGIEPTGEVVAEMASAAGTEAQIGECVAAAKVTLAKPGRTLFDRGTHIWNAWLAQGGLVGELMRPVAADNRRAIDAVSEQLRRLSRRGLEAELRAADDQQRAPGKQRIEGKAKHVLIDRAAGAIEISKRWVALCTRATSKRRTDSRQAELAATLCGRLLSLRPEVEAALGEWSEAADPEVAGAAAGARLILADVYGLIGGHALAGPEMPLDIAANRDVLRTDIEVSESLEPLSVSHVTTDAIRSAAVAWEDAFERRMRMADHVGTQAVVAILRAEKSGLVAECEAKRVAALARDRAGLEHSATREREALELARRCGTLDEDAATQIESGIERASAPDRLDIGHAFGELKLVELQRQEVVAATLASFRADVEAASSADDRVAALRPRIERLLSTGDLATAEELLTCVRAGVEPASAYSSEYPVEAFFPSVPDGLRDGITEEVVAAARNRQKLPGLDFSSLSTEAAITAASALDGWRRAGRARRDSWGELLFPALRLCGIEYNDEVRVLQATNTAERQWLDLKGVQRVGEALVPEYGSASGKTLRVLLAWQQPSDAKLVEWIRAEATRVPLVCLYFGTMAPDARRQLANRLRNTKSRPLVVIDDSLVAWAAAVGRGTWDIVLKAALPFSAVNPYRPTGIPPVEMFYGRELERTELAYGNTHLIYGGRRFGKSALLHAAARLFEETPGQRAVYIDLGEAAIRTTHRPEAIWDLMAAKLAAADVIRKPSGKPRAPAPANSESVVRGVREWQNTDGRRLLLLLDECDDFFDADADVRFDNTRTLKVLMEDSGNRCKVVFAGLHQVQRFASVPNQPLAHLGRPIPIGPLPPAPAFRLLARPLEALGWTFQHEDLVNRILSYCNYTPILLQECGSALVEMLQARPLGAGEPPQRITDVEVKAVLDSSRLGEAIRSRFSLTLALDPRYKAIAYVIARSEAHPMGIGTTELRQECHEWWPDGFVGVTEDAFGALLEELVALGVVSGDRASGWRIRGANVMRLLGSQHEIWQRLEDLIKENPPVEGFAGADRRRVLNEESGLRSPLTEAQLAGLVGEGRNQLRVVIGSGATGVQSVSAALGSVAGSLQRFDFEVCQSRAKFAAALQGGQRHRVVFSDLRDVRGDQVAASVRAGLNRTGPGTCSVVLVLRPRQRLDVPPECTDFVSLARYTTSTLRAWSVDFEKGFTDDRSRVQLASATGGWPRLIDEVGMLCRMKGSRVALAEVSASLLQADYAAEFVKSVAIDESPLAEVYDAILEFAPTGGDRKTITEIAAEVTSMPLAGVERCVEALQTAGVIDDRGALLIPEPVFAEAWLRTKDKRSDT